MLWKHPLSFLVWTKASLQGLQTSSATCWISKARRSCTWETTSLATSSNRRSVRAGRRSWWCRSSPKSCKCGRRRKVRTRGAGRPHPGGPADPPPDDSVGFCRSVWGAETSRCLHSWEAQVSPWVRLECFTAVAAEIKTITFVVVWRHLGNSAMISKDIGLVQRRMKVSSSGEAWGTRASLTSPLSSDADPQDGHVLRSDGQPPAQRRQADAVRQPAGALRRPVLVQLPQPAALPLQLSLPGSSGPGQPPFRHAEVSVATDAALTHLLLLSAAPRGRVSDLHWLIAPQLDQTLLRGGGEAAWGRCCYFLQFFWSHA